MAIKDIGFLTRPVGYSNGGNVFTPNMATEDLGILENDPVMLDQAIKEFDAGQYIKNITKDADFKQLSDDVTDRAVGEASNAISDYLKKKGYKITFDVKGFKNWVMGKNPDGSAKTSQQILNPKENRKQLGKILSYTPAGFVKKYITRQLLGITREVAPNLVESISNYFQDDPETQLEKSQIDENYFSNLAGPDGDRNERIAYRETVKNEEDVVKFLENYKVFGDLKESTGKNLRLDISAPGLSEEFGNIYNQQNIFKNEYIKSIIGEKNFKVITRSAKNISPETKAYMKAQGKAKVNPELDNYVGMAETVLRNYKEANPETTGYELKISNLGDLDIDDLLLSNPELAKYLTREVDVKISGVDAPKGIVASRNVRLDTNRKNEIIARLKKEGVLEELGLDQYSIHGTASARTTDPQVLQYLEDNPEVLSINNRTNLFQKILTPDQRKPILDILTKTREQTKDLGLDYTGKIQLNNRVDNNIQMNINRMLRTGLRRGLTIQEVLDKVEAQTNDPDFLGKFVPIVAEKVKLRDKIQFYKSKGVELDDVVLAHITAVAKDLDLTLKFDNVLIGKAKPNSKEGQLISRASQINKELKQKNIGQEKIIELKEELKNVLFEMDETQKHIRIDDLSQFEKDADKKFKETMKINQMIATQMRDGGIVSINKMIEPLRAER
tara:strand:- start:37 stop:2052 length:2016 start_codon:yes stop_codon:yes gene_type:complete